MRMKISPILFLLCIFMVFSCQPAFADTIQEVDLIKELYGPIFKPVKVVGPVIMGPASELIRVGQLRDYANLKIKNAFKDLFDPEYKSESRTKDLKIIISILTVGDDYPVAWNVEIRFDVDDDRWVYFSQYIGYCNKDDLLQEIKNTITNLIEESAILFYKARGEL